jgi:soluble lytic murein transglycosylase
MKTDEKWPFRAFVIGSAIFSAVAARVIFSSQRPKEGERLNMGARYQIAKALVDKWYAVLTRVPAATVLAVMSHESGFNPSAMNLTGKDLDRGGAYGLMQMTAATASEVVKTLAGIKLPAVVATLQKYDPSAPRSLLDPDVNVLLGMGYLNLLAKGFNNDLDMVVAAYNRGRKGAESVLAKGGKQAITALPYVVAVNILKTQLEATSA